MPDINAKTVGIAGVAFKPNSDDIRETRAVPIVEVLLKEGATVIAYDPLAMEEFKELFPNIQYASSGQDFLDKTDIIIIQTEWDEFEKLDFSDKIVIDGRRVESAKSTAKVYEGICW